MNQIVGKYQHKKPYSIRVSTDTMEERLPHKETPVSPQSEDKLVAIHRPSIVPQSSGISYETTDIIGYRAHEGTNTDPSVELVHFYEDNQSSSGWSHVAYPIPGVTSKYVMRRLSGFYENGLIYLFVEHQLKTAPATDVNLVTVLYATLEGNVPIWQEWKGGGTSGTLLNKVRQLCIHRRRDASHFIYGMSHGYEGRPQFFMVFPEKTNFEHALGDRKIGFKPVRDKSGLVPGAGEDKSEYAYQIAELPHSDEENPANAFELLRLKDGGIEFHQVFVETANETSGGLKFRFEKDRYAALQATGVDLKNARIQVVPSLDGETVFVRTSDNRLGVVENFQSDKAQFVSLMTDLGPDKINRLAIAATGEQEDQQFAHLLFATDSEDLLWIRKATSSLNSTEWVLLGDKAAEVACPRVTKSGGEVFLVAPAAKLLNHKVKNAADSTWMTQAVAASTVHTANLEDFKKVSKISAHVFEIEMTDADGFVLRDQNVVITSNAWINLYIDGVSYRTGPQLPLKVKTDAMSGRIRAVLKTPGIGAPEIYATIPGEAADLLPPFRPNDRIGQRLSGNSRGYSVAKDISGAVPKKYGPMVQKIIKHYGEASEKQLRNCPSKRILKGAYRFSVHNGGVFEDVSQENDIAQILTEDWKDDLGLFDFGGILNLIGNAFHKVEQVVVGILDSSVKLLVTIDGKLHELVTKTYDDVLGTLEAIGTMLSDAFRAMGHFVENIAKKILEAVSFLLNGEDVFAVNDAYQAAIKGVIRMVESAVNTGADRMDALFKENIRKADAFLDTMIDKSVHGKELAKKHETEEIDLNGVKVKSLTNITRQNSSGANIMGTAMSQYFAAPNVSFMNADNAGIIDDLISRLRSIHTNDLTPELNKVIDEIKKDGVLEEIKKDPFVIFKILKTFLKSILEAVETVFLFLIKLLLSIIDVVLQALDAEIDLPLLSTIVSLWSGDPNRKIKLLDVITLPGAFIGTVIWKIISGGQKLVSKENAKIFVDWMDKPKGPFDIWDIIDGKYPNIPEIKQDNDLIVDKKEKFPKWPSIIIIVFKGLKIKGNIANILLFSKISISLKIPSIYKAEIPDVVAGFMFAINVFQAMISLVGSFVQWLFEIIYLKTFEKGKSFRRVDQEHTARLAGMVGVQTVVVLAVFAAGLYIYKAINSQLPTIPFWGKQLMVCFLNLAFLASYVLVAAVAAIDEGLTQDELLEVVLYLIRFFGTAAIVAGDVTAVAAYFVDEQITKLGITFASLVLLGGGTLLNETGAFAINANILVKSGQSPELNCKDSSI
ncbi:MAG: hypothetical protein RIG26_10170 [Thalassospira sp.]|uniref:hypothetical protein n=1 Tax=Thalassospira sp. TaxID=1912094 RepID=UPI0032EDAD53